MRAVCLICASTRLRSLYDGVRDHYAIARGEYRFLVCEDCGSATLDPLPGRPADLYPPEYTFKAANAGERRGLRRRVEWHLFYRPVYRQRLKVLRRLTGLTCGSILELGCGSGLMLQTLVEAGYDAQGIDGAAADVAHAREHLGLRASQGDLQDLVLPPDRYDAVLAFFVFEHLTNPAAVVARVFRSLRVGGWIVLGLPVLDSVQSQLLGRRWATVTEAPRHVTIPSFEGARRLLVEAGFSDVRALPSALRDNAGVVTLSLLPSAATPVSATARGRLAFGRRLAGALLLLPSLLLALAERRPGAGGVRAGMMIFCGRK
jgi:SAM-dependent methyltransferase